MVDEEGTARRGKGETIAIQLGLKRPRERLEGGMEGGREEEEGGREDGREDGREGGQEGGMEGGGGGGREGREGGRKEVKRRSWREGHKGKEGVHSFQASGSVDSTAYV